jgi:hypothetical protein
MSICPQAMPLSQIIADLAVAHETLISRPESRSEDEKADYERLMNRLAAETMWSMASRRALEKENESVGLDIDNDDMLSNLMRSAPRLARGVLLHITRMPLDRRIAIMDLSCGWPH